MITVFGIYVCMSIYMFVYLGWDLEIITEYPTHWKYLAQSQYAVKIYTYHIAVKDTAL